MLKSYLLLTFFRFSFLWIQFNGLALINTAVSRINDFYGLSVVLERNQRLLSVTYRIDKIVYSSTKGEANQAAAFVYTYYKVEANPHIDSLILSRQTDAGAEIAQDLALGLTDTGGRRKYIYEVFKHIDGPNSAAVTEFAKPIIGITSWSQIGSNR